MSLAQFWATIRAAWLQIVLMTLVAGGAAYAFASSLPEQYTAKARIMINLDASDPTLFAPMRSETAAGYIATELGLVTDDAVMQAAVARLGWPQNPEVVAAWQADPGSIGDVTTWAAHRLAQNIAVHQLEDSAIIEIYYSASTLDAAKQVVALVRTTFIDQRQKLRAETARRASDWNRAQAARALATLQAAEAQRAAFASANNLAVDTPTGGLDYQAQAIALTQTTSPLGQSTARVATDPMVDKLTHQINAIDAQIAVLRLTGDQRNPTLIALAAQRDTVAQQLAHENAVIRAGPDATTGQIGVVRAQRDDAYLQARLALIGRTPLYDRLAAMDRDVAFKATLYNNAAARVANFDHVAAAPSGASVLGDVIADPAASFPNIPLMVGIASGAALALGVAVALLGELSRHQVRNSEDLAFVVGAPVLAVIAAADNRGDGWSRFAGRLSRFRPRLGRRTRGRKDAVLVSG